MQKQTSLYIPKPCHEDWNKMTPTQQGKFCGSCNKQVVDFSLMSDTQILNFLSNQSGKLCGRFDAEQLQRPLIETKITKKKSWWMALTMPLLFLFDKAEAQGNVTIVRDTISNVPSSKDLINHQLLGDVSFIEPNKEIIVKGKVLDKNNDPIAYATIMQKGTEHGTVSDSLGNFSIAINSDENRATIVASYVGFETIEKQIQLEESDTINITLQMSEYVSRGLVLVVGGAISSYHPVKSIDTIKTAVKKILNIPAFKIYPNPAVKGNIIHLEIKQAGEYQVLLFDDQSRLIQSEEINTVSKKSTITIQLPSNIPAGIYYLRLLDEQKKKPYTEKIIIQ